MARHKLTALFVLITFLVSQNPFFCRRLAGAAEGLEPLRVAVVPLMTPKGNQAKAALIAGDLRTSLSGVANTAVASTSDTLELMAGRPELLDLKIDTLGAVVRRAFDDYYVLALDESLRRVDEALAAIDERGTFQKPDFDLAGAHIIRGMDYLALGSRAKAMEALTEVARLDPDRVLSEADFSPTVREAYSAAKKGLLQRGTKGWLVVRSSPKGADVRINGVVKGKTPFVAEGFPEGFHYIAVEKTGYQPYFEKVQVLSKDPTEVIAKLARGRSLDREETVLAGPVVNDLADTGAQAEIGVGFGKALSVDRVVFVAAENLGWGWRVSGRVVDVETGRADQLKQVEVGELPEDAGGVVTSLTQWIEKGRVGGAEAVATLGPRSKPFYKREAFWIGLGIAALGAGVGTGIALSDSGGGTGGSGGGGSGLAAVSLEIPGAVPQ